MVKDCGHFQSIALLLEGTEHRQEEKLIRSNPFPLPALRDLGETGLGVEKGWSSSLQAATNTAS